MRVAFASAPSTEALAAIHSKLPGYGKGEPLHQASLVVSAPAPAAPVVTPPFEVGTSFRSNDGLYVLQSRRDGMSVSRLRPYLDWESLFEEMWRAWMVYRDMLAPARVKRVSTRFINQINVPYGRDLDEFFLVSPRLPEGAPNFIGTFTTAVLIPFAEQKANAIMRMAMPLNSNLTEVPVIADFDILHDCDFAPEDDKMLRDAIGALRPIKNRLFFGSLTEKAMELFQ